MKKNSVFKSTHKAPQVLIWPAQVHQLIARSRYCFSSTNRTCHAGLQFGFFRLCKVGVVPPSCKRSRSVKAAAFRSLPVLYVARSLASALITALAHYQAFTRGQLHLFLVPLHIEASFVRLRLFIPAYTVAIRRHLCYIDSNTVLPPGSEAKAFVCTSLGLRRCAHECFHFL